MLVTVLGLKTSHRNIEISSWWAVAKVRVSSVMNSAVDSLFIGLFFVFDGESLGVSVFYFFYVFLFFGPCCESF